MVRRDAGSKRTVGVLPSCASMGGGGMRYVASDPIPIQQSLSM